MLENTANAVDQEMRVPAPAAAMREFREERSGGQAPQADTFPKLLIHNADALRGRPAIRHKDLGIWQTWTWDQMLDEVRAFSVGLAELGLKRGDKVAIIGANRPRLYWAICAAQALGAIPVPIYADSVADEMAYVLEHAEVTIAVVEDQEQVDKIISIADRLAALSHIVYDEPRGLRDYDHARLKSFTDVQALGREKLARDPRRAGSVAAIDRRREGLATSRSFSTRRARPGGPRA